MELNSLMGIYVIPASFLLTIVVVGILFFIYGIDYTLGAVVEELETISSTIIDIFLASPVLIGLSIVNLDKILCKISGVNYEKKNYIKNRKKIENYRQQRKRST